MKSYLKHYIDGAWVESDGGRRHEVINPATEQPCTEITLGSDADVDRAVAAARRAFETFSRTYVDERITLLARVYGEYGNRLEDIAQAIALEMGCPISTARAAQATRGPAHLKAAIDALREFKFEERVGRNKVVHEAVGVAALITPWNWPINQIVAKVAPALAAGCTMVLKPSEEAPGCAAIFAEVMDAAGVPPGVFNLVQGDGAGVGTALAKHPGVDMVSFTGSTRAGIAVAKNAADTVKRVHQELGGKSPNIILEGADLPKAIPVGLMSVLVNSGQSCIAPTRLLVHESQADEAAAVAAAVMNKAEVGDPSEGGRHLGPLVNAAQFARVQGLIEGAIREGAKLEAGGPGRPDGRNVGFYVRPTLFSHVTPDMAIAREEIFGPVVTIIPYKDDADAIRIANDTVYGLSAMVCGDPEKARAVVPRLRAGMVYVNTGLTDPNVAFGGYKQSGNGREYGRFGIAEFLEVKSVIGEVA